MNNISIHSIDTVCLKETCPVHHLCARFERYEYEQYFNPFH